LNAELKASLNILQWL